MSLIRDGFKNRIFNKFILKSLFRMSIHCSCFRKFDNMTFQNKGRTVLHFFKLQKESLFIEVWNSWFEKFGKVLLEGLQLNHGAAAKFYISWNFKSFSLRGASEKMLLNFLWIFYDENFRMCCVFLLLPIIPKCDFPVFRFFNFLVKSVVKSDEKAKKEKDNSKRREKIASANLYKSRCPSLICPRFTWSLCFHSFSLGTLYKLSILKHWEKLILQTFRGEIKLID